MSTYTLLSPFQQEKFEYYFKFFDSDGNRQLELDDLDGFMKKVLDFTGWEKDSSDALICYEVHECFFSTMIEKAAKRGHDKITLRKWFEMWEHLIPGCSGMADFPIWLRLLPKCLFRIIDSKRDGKIDVKELSNYYVKLLGINPESVDSLATFAMEQMTDKGRYPLTMDSFNQIFANFLIGKTPYGPGRLIFGCFEHMVERTSFQLIKGPPERIYDPLAERRKQQIATCSPRTPASLIKLKFFNAA